VKLAAEHGSWQGIGQDIVNHCVNDILVQNARPLFFLDYIASSKLVPENVAAVVDGIAEACRAAGCALIGGETAEMPGVYAEGAFDVAGTVIGLVDRSALLPQPEAMQAGDVLFGLPSSGPHTNGYSLIRRAISGQDVTMRLADGRTLIDALLAPHRCYVSEIDRLQRAGVQPLGMAHLTGGGFLENIPRVLPVGLDAVVDVSSWQTPELFELLVAWAHFEDAEEPYRVFNMGIGMVLIVRADDAEKVLAILPEAVAIGRLQQGSAKASVILEGMRK
jgi:phosphoribosylformylglycinamidine cyclo-ligase